MKEVIHAACLILLSSAVWAIFNVDTGTISDENWRSDVPLGGIGCGKLEILDGWLVRILHRKRRLGQAHRRA